jgi:hypothetical protein
MRISTNIKRPANWYQGTRIVITDNFYGSNQSYNPYFSTDYNTNIGMNNLTDLIVDIPDNYLKVFLNNPSYKIIVYALAYENVIDIASDAAKTYYSIGNKQEGLFKQECTPNTGESINENEQKFIEKNVKTNNVAYNKYYKFEIKPEKETPSANNFGNITLKFTYEYSSNCDVNKYLNHALKPNNDTMPLDNTIIYNGSSETFEITQVVPEDLLLGSSKLDNQMSYINYKSYAASNYSPVLSLDVRDKDYTFLGWYKIHSNTQYKLGDTIQFSSLFNGFVSSQKNATFDYNKLNNTEGDYVYFFAVYTSQRNEIIPFENRKMRIMKVY